MTACPLDGNIRTVVAREPDAVAWHCSWCGETTVERVQDEPREPLSREQGSERAKLHACDSDPVVTIQSTEGVA